jgi:ectoine hydroxylase-related dioxygenase (phytanoyl-CoA dioxygenase family)
MHTEEVECWAREVRKVGFVIVEDFLSPEQVAEQRAAMQRVPVLQGGTGGNSHMDHTIRAHNLIGKTRACDPIVEDPRLLALVRGVLGEEIQISVTTLMDMLPGEREQNYHQDDRRYKLPRPHIPLVFNSIIALDEFTVANGATRIIPNSHRWGEEENAAMAASGLDSAFLIVPFPDRFLAKTGSGLIRWKLKA